MKFLSTLIVALVQCSLGQEIRLLSISQSHQTPRNDFKAYLSSGDSFPFWSASSNICWTVTLRFTAPTGTYEIWWDIDVELPKTIGGNQVGTNPLRIDDRINHAGGSNWVSLPIIPEANGFFKLKKL